MGSHVRRLLQGGAPLCALAIVALLASSCGKTSAPQAPRQWGRDYADITSPSTLTAVSLTTRTDEKPISIPTNVDVVWASPNGRTAYLGTSGNPTFIYHVNLVSGTLGRPLSLGGDVGSLTGMAVTSNGQKAYLVGGPSVVDPLNLHTGSFANPIEVPNGDPTVAIALDQRTSTLFVSTANSLQSNNGGAVEGINLVTGKAGLSVVIPNGSGPLSMSRDDSTVYVLNDSGIYPVNSTTGALGRPLPSPAGLAQSGGSIAVGPSGYIYVTHGCSRTVDMVNPLSGDSHEVPFGTSSGACHIAIP
jgi:hypothetical protein